MKKKILFIIIILILVAIGIGGSLYFISYNNDSQAKNEDENSMSENIVNSIIDDTNIVSNELESNLSEQNIENTMTEADNEKQETSETKETTQTTTQATSSPSNNNQSSQKEETVTKSTTTTTQKTISSTSQLSSSENSKQEETKTELKVERCTNNNNHSLGIGNSGKWFSLKSDAIAYYNQQTKYWGEQWENNKIDNDTYYKNCPSGYEVWDCMYCGKWTINFYYR